MNCKYCRSYDIANEYTCPCCARKGCENCMPDGDGTPCQNCVDTQADLPESQRNQVPFPGIVVPE